MKSAHDPKTCKLCQHITKMEENIDRWKEEDRRIRQRALAGLIALGLVAGLVVLLFCAASGRL